MKKYLGWYRSKTHSNRIRINDKWLGIWVIDESLGLNRPLFPWGLYYDTNKWTYYYGQHSTLRYINEFLDPLWHREYETGTFKGYDSIVNNPNWLKVKQKNGSLKICRYRKSQNNLTERKSR